MIRLGAAGAATLLFIGRAEAHSPFPGVAPFYGGLLHPLLTPATVVGLLALALLVGQHAPKSSQIAFPAAVFALAATIALPSPLPSSAAELLLLVFALSACILVVAEVDPGVLGAALLAAAAAAACGLAVGAEAAAGFASVPARAGSAVGCALAVALLGGLAAAMRRPWQRIALRVAGSWTAASAMLVLALQLLPPGPG